MHYSPLGQIAHDEWYRTTKIRNNIELGSFVVMPNHIHGIIIINRRGELHSPMIMQDTLGVLPQGECNSPLRSPSQTIGAIVRGYKSSVSKINNHLGLHIGITI